MDEQLEDLLVRSFDDQLTAVEQERLAEALRNSEALRAEKAQLELLRAQARSIRATFQPGFTDAVMAKISESDLNSGVLSLYQRMAYAGAAAVVFLLGWHVWSGGSFSLDGILGIESATTDMLTFNVIGH